MGDVADHRTWNVFRRRHAHGLCCAVPADAPLPTFLLTGDWSFALQIVPGDPALPGFSPPSAEIGTRFNGFYLFLGFGGPLSGTTPRSGAAPLSGATPSSFPVEIGIGGEPKTDLAHSPDAETPPA